MEMELLEDESEKAIESGPSAPRSSYSTRNVQLPSRTVEDMIPQPNPVAAATSRDRTYLDQGSKVHGKLKFNAPVQIDGQVEGEIDAHDTSVVIGKSAVVTAKIKAVSVMVGGVVNGEISASQRIELQASAKVSGSLAAPKLVMQEGALFEGNCTMPRAALGEERKSGTSRKEERLASETNS
jgi:cytoskeletal protein CcmA (bactofilin family)